MIEYTFIVPGQPRPKVRQTGRTWRLLKMASKRTFRYPDDPQKAQVLIAKIKQLQDMYDYSNLIKWIWKAGHFPTIPQDRAVGLGFVFKVTGYRRPDLSNCIKLYEDSLNGFAYIDDKQVVTYLFARIEYLCPVCPERPRYVRGKNKGKYYPICDNPEKCEKSCVEVTVKDLGPLYNPQL